MEVMSQGIPERKDVTEWVELLKACTRGDLGAARMPLTELSGVMAKVRELYPECEKLYQKRNLVIALNEFLDWLSYETNYCPSQSNTTVIYRFFGIDPVKLETEREAVLAAAHRIHMSIQKE